MTEANGKTFSLPWPESLDCTDEQRQKIQELFPEVAPPYAAVGEWILVQERKPKDMVGAKGLIHAPDSTKERDQLDMNIGRIVSMGSYAYRNPISQQDDEPEFALGDFVRIPRNMAIDRPEEGKIVYRAIKASVISGRIVKASAVLR